LRYQFGGKLMRRCFAFLIIAAGLAPGLPATAATYVDESACAGYHAAQHKAWTGSP